MLHFRARAEDDSAALPVPRRAIPLRGFIFMQATRAPFVVPDPKSAPNSDESSEEERPTSAQKPDTVSDSESMSDDDSRRITAFADTTHLPDVMPSSSDDNDDEETGGSSLAKDLANEIMAPDDEEVLDADFPEKGKGRGKHARPKKGWQKVSLWKIDPLTRMEVIGELKAMAQSLYDKSGTSTPSCK